MTSPCHLVESRSSPTPTWVCPVPLALDSICGFYLTRLFCALVPDNWRPPPRITGMTRLLRMLNGVYPNLVAYYPLITGNVTVEVAVAVAFVRDDYPRN